MLSNMVIVAAGPLAAESIRHALRLARGCRVAARFDGRLPLAGTFIDARPDAVLFDDMGRHLLTSRIREARALVPGAKMIFVSSEFSSDALLNATEAGADAAISRSVDAMSFATLVRGVATGTVFNALPVARGADSASSDGLTAREVEVLQMVAGGASNIRIARSLWVTEQTVKYHLTNIYRKLGVSNRTEASHHAHLRGYIRPGLAAFAPPADEVAS